VKIIPEYEADDLWSGSRVTKEIIGTHLVHHWSGGVWALIM